MVLTLRGKEGGNELGRSYMKCSFELIVSSKENVLPLQFSPVISSFLI
jgi:hypothetical protein